MTINRAAAVIVLFSSTIVASPVVAAPQATAQAAQANPAGRQLGTVKAISGNSITLTADSGATISVAVAGDARLLRIAPGQRSLNDATPIQLPDVQVGDRVLLRGTASDDAKTFTASTVVVMKSSDVAAKQQRERQDWDTRGVGGIVTSLDVASGTIKLSTGGMGANTAVTLTTTKDTVVRRYAPDSVKFDDSVRTTLDKINPGDQLRARGNRNADGTEIAAEEIVAGTFKNFAGLITSVDTTAKTITINDLATKKPVVIRISDDSQMHKLPETAAQMLAMRLKGTRPGAPNADAGAARQARPMNQPNPAMMGGGRPATGGPGAPGASRGGDLHQILSRIPTISLTEMQKGQAVILVATLPQGATPASAITLLTGVEPLLTASPNDNSAAMLLSPWNLNAPTGDGGMQQ